MKFTSETLVLKVRDGLVFNILQELLYVFKTVITGVVRVEGSVEVGDGSLCIQLAFLLGLGNRPSAF